ncbi:MAG: thioredoxin family protein [Propionibacteriaceae bacterium]
MTGLYVVVAAAVLAIAFGVCRHVTDGRVRGAGSRSPRLEAADLGTGLGTDATFVQFSSAVCAPCRATHRVLSKISAEDEGVVHVDVDAEARLDLVERYGITRTPTVLLLDGTGVVRHRIVGAARAPEVLEALEEVAARRAA